MFGFNTRCIDLTSTVLAGKRFDLAGLSFTNRKCLERHTALGTYYLQPAGKRDPAYITPACLGEKLPYEFAGRWCQPLGSFCKPKLAAYSSRHHIESRCIPAQDAFGIRCAY